MDPPQPVPGSGIQQAVLVPPQGGFHLLTPHTLIACRHPEPSENIVHSFFKETTLIPHCCGCLQLLSSSQCKLESVHSLAVPQRGPSALEGHA